MAREELKNSTIEKLRSEIRGLERAPLERKTHAFSETPFPELNALLPGGGLPLGCIVELLAEDNAVGAFSLALKMASGAIESKAAWAVVDSDGTFYAPAAAQLGLDVGKLIVVRARPDDAAWAFNQLLRCPEIGASFMLSRSMDNMTYRRLQLAAERGGNLGVVLRPASAIRRPCWAELRLRIDDCRLTNDDCSIGARRLRITILHSRGGAADNATADVRMCP